jgi:hypothetical protein
MTDIIALIKDYANEHHMWQSDTEFAVFCQPDSEDGRIKLDNIRRILKLQTDGIRELADVLKSEGISPELNAPCYKALLDIDRIQQANAPNALREQSLLHSECEDWDEAHELRLRLSSKGV